MAAASQAVPLVGCRDELAGLTVALDGLRGRSTRWLAVSGEPGIGKTRLLAELCARAEARDHLVLAGSGAELERELPFGVWVAALDDHVAALGPSRLEALVGDRVDELARVLPSAGAAVPGGLQDERFRAHRAVRALLQGLAERRPVVLVLDDVHWADDASVELIAHLLRRPAGARLLVALAFREGGLPAGLRAALEAAAREGSVTELALSALSRDDADAFMGRELPAAMRDEIYRQSGGNPFYLEQLARAGGERQRPDRDALAGVPGAVAVALAQEIRQLGEPARRLAWGAAVAGDPAELGLAAAAAGLSEAEALGAIDELVAADVLRRTAVARRYAFRHPLVRRTVYEGAGEAWRLAAHARAAGALASRPGAIVERAHHLERCAAPGDAEAATVLERAAHQAAGRAPAVAATLFAAALRTLPGDGGDRRLGLLVALASAQSATGRLPEALESLQASLAVLGPERVDLRVRLIAACASCENVLGRHEAAHARLLRALADLPVGGSAAAAELQVELAADALFHCDFAAMARWAEAAAASVRALDDGGLRALADALVCFAAYSTGRPDAAEAARATAAAGLDALPDDELAARLDLPYYLGFAEYFCERYEDAARHLRRGVAVARVAGHSRFVVFTMVGLAQALERLGRLDEALGTAEAAVEAARLSGNPQAVGFALVAEAWTAAEAGDSEHARAAAEEAVAILEGLDESVLTRATHAHVGVIWLEIGEPGRCVEQLRAAGLPDLPLIEPGRRGWLYAVLARAELARGDRDAAVAWAERSTATVDGLGLPLAEAWALHARALLALDDGDASGAAELALAAAGRADAVRTPVPAARCRALAGVALAAAGDRDAAVRLLTRAEEELRACHAERHRDEVARHLRRLGQRVSTRRRRFDRHHTLADLSRRELEIAERVALGRTNREIAGQLYLSEKTVEGYLTNVFTKLGVSSRAEVAEAVGRSRPD